MVGGWVRCDGPRRHWQNPTRPGGGLWDLHGRHPDPEPREELQQHIGRLPRLVLLRGAGDQAFLIRQRSPTSDSHT